MAKTQFTFNEIHKRKQKLSILHNIDWTMASLLRRANYAQYFNENSEWGISVCKDLNA